jgi:hypothetical protein
VINGLDKDEKREGDFDVDADADADEMDIARPPRFGWAELQVGVVREAVATVEALPGRLVFFFSSTISNADKFRRLPRSCPIRSVNIANIVHSFDGSGAAASI